MTLFSLFSLSFFRISVEQVDDPPNDALSLLNNGQIAADVFRSECDGWRIDGCMCNYFDTILNTPLRLKVMDAVPCLIEHFIGGPAL